MTTQSTSRAPLPGGRVAVQLKWHLRGAAALGAVSALGYAAVIGWRTEANGVVTASAFAIGLPLRHLRAGRSRPSEHQDRRRRAQDATGPGGRR